MNIMKESKMDVKQHSPKKIGEVLDLKKLVMAPLMKKIRSFKPKYRFYIDQGSYIIKTVLNGYELEQALKLRHDIFYQELLKRRQFTGMDVDRFDFGCDHIVVVEKSTGSFVGTYRMNSTVYTKKFYSATEFNISSLMKLQGHKVELGRACIHPAHRNGAVITLLWSGIAKYIELTGARYLFGCSSIHTTNKLEIALIYQYLQENCLASKEMTVTPHKSYRVHDLGIILNNLDEIRNIQKTPYNEQEIKKMIPTLIKSYIKTGAKICGEPAIDWSFKCIDLLTILDVSTINDKVGRKFKLRKECTVEQEKNPGDNRRIIQAGNAAMNETQMEMVFHHC